MDNLIFCLNATIPIFLTLMLGYFLRKINLYDDSFVAQMNKFVFKAALPALLFMNVAAVSYTHLDVYKRQPPYNPNSSGAQI